ncbi:YbhB/YbcL family Raf kinase inhibitor-like protein [Candidatus Uhrbacteria bacterium]|nr:YbhB/YbcL family Raf kinase inhibitor-like protein [Candidatus Uhrbacteria bacterium]
MQLTSSAFADGESIPSRYTCDGENISPPLTVSDVPFGTKSLVLLMDDPDVPKTIRPDGMWDHWVVFNISPETVFIEEGKNPAGTLGKNTGGKLAYGGPCPPDREHRYFFKLYALDSMLDLPAGASKLDVEAAMQGHIIEQVQLIGKYLRSN